MVNYYSVLFRKHFELKGPYIIPIYFFKLSSNTDVWDVL